MFDELDQLRSSRLSRVAAVHLRDDDGRDSLARSDGELESGDLFYLVELAVRGVKCLVTASPLMSPTKVHWKSPARVGTMSAT